MRISDWSSDVCSSDLAHHDIVVVHQVAGDLAGRKPVVVDLGHRRHLHGGPRQEHLLRLRKLLRLERPLDHLIAAPPGEVDDGAAGNAVEEAVGRRCVDLAVLHQENVGTSRLKSEEHTSELQSLMRISYAVFCLKKKTAA